jgi:hypothetical protein
VDRPSSISNSERSPSEPSRAGWPLAALFACALLVLGELGTRAWFKPPYVSLDTYTSYYPNWPEYGFEGSRACFRVRDEMACARTQDMNVIPQTFPAKKPDGELRIVVVGSSVSWEGSGRGQGSSEGNYPSRTLDLLHRAHPDRKLRLINLSVPGFGTTREVVRFREALEYEPDLLVVHVHDTNEIREDQRRAYVAQLHSGVAGKLLYLHSVAVLKAWWSDFLSVRAARAVAAESGEDTESDAQKYERWQAGIQRNVQTMLGLARARGIPVVVVGPSRADRRHGVRDRALNPIFEAQIGGSAQFLNVSALFTEEYARRPRPLFKDNVHYSAEGTRLVAAALASRIEMALPALHGH